MLLIRTIIVIVLVLAGSECATRRFDSPPVHKYDSRSSASYIPLEAMNPMNQPKSSSYSIMETLSDSRGTVTASRPSGHYSDYNFVGGPKKKRPPRPQFQRESPLHVRRTSVLQRQGQSKPSYKNEPPRPQLQGQPFLLDRGTSTFEGKPASLPYSKETSAKFVDDSGHGDSEEGYDLGKHFDEKDDSKFVEAHKIREGERAGRGNRKQEKYDEADEKSHDNEERKEAIAEKQGRKKQHSLDREHVDKQYRGREGEKGITQKKKSGYEKNYRKSGYRRVHKKEEYKLDEEFFERSHNGKDRRERVKEQEKHAEEKADAVKKKSHDSGLLEKHSEKKAVEENDIHHAEKTGHKKETEEQQKQEERLKHGEKSDVEEDSKQALTKDTKSRGSFFDDLF